MGEANIFSIFRNLFHDKEKTSRKNLEIILQYIDKQVLMILILQRSNEFSSRLIHKKVQLT